MLIFVVCFFFYLYESIVFEVLNDAPLSLQHLVGPLNYYSFCVLFVSASVVVVVVIWFHSDLPFDAQNVITVRSFCGLS